MRFLLDTNVVSELRKGPRADRRVAAWFHGLDPDDLFLSVLVVGEIRRGIEGIRRRDTKTAQALDRWLLGLAAGFEDRILPVDRRVAEEWGRMNVPDPLPVLDALMAATAKVHGLVLATRNVKDVASTGVSTVNPFVG
ncbi:MAG: type II toxin-antitoxin system VapC family toxin [Acidobacteriota bacterium]|nr:type II toxin-antitoxin system VapC family toxin [Acidobacteriota bacterium]